MKFSSSRLLLFCICAVAIPINVFSNGTVYLNNRVPGVVDAPVYLLDGVGSVPLDGPLFVAQLFAGPVGVSQFAFMPVGEPVPFRSGRAAGYIVPSIVEMPEFPGGHPAALQLRVGIRCQRDSSGFLEMGRSRIIEVPLGDSAANPPTVPADLKGLESFHVGIPVQNLFNSIPHTRYGAWRSYFVAAIGKSYSVSTYVSSYIRDVRWQKQNADGSWTLVPDHQVEAASEAFKSPELRFGNIQHEHSGNYRLTANFWHHFLECGGVAVHSMVMKIDTVESIPNPSLEFLDIEGSDGPVRLKINGIPGQALVIESTANFQDWETDFTVIEYDQPIEFERFLFEGQPGPHRFYRLRVIP